MCVLYNLMLPCAIDYGENSSACALLVQLKCYLVRTFIPSYLYPISCYYNTLN